MAETAEMAGAAGEAGYDQGMIAKVVTVVVLMMAAVCVAAESSKEDRAKYRLDRGAKRADVGAAGKTIVALTDAFRKENKLPAMKVNDELTKTAESFAKFMARTHEYGHEADGRTPADRATANKYAYCLVLENIAMQFRSDGYASAEQLAKQFVEGWKNSPGHRKNMLHVHGVETGVAVAMSENGVYYAVQMFGRPESMKFDLRVENHADAAVRYTLDGQAYDLPPQKARIHTVCTPPTLTFDLPKGSSVPTGEQLTPAKATTFTIKRDNEGLAVDVTNPE